MAILWPLDDVRVTGDWANSPEFYAQFGQAGHNGIDLGCAVGTPVYSTDAGVIHFEGWGQNSSWMGKIAGISIIIRHGWGFSGYAHLNSTVVNTGQHVGRGQLIGYSGQTGLGTGPHLHFETFPPSPNFSNGFAGRVNPHTFGLVHRGAAPAPTPPAPIIDEEDDMYSKIQLDGGWAGLWNMATGEVRHIDSSSDWDQFDKNLKSYRFKDMPAFEAFKNKYPFQLKVTAGNVTVDPVAIAKAVNDDVSRRMAQ